MFSEKESQCLPVHKPYDHAIELVSEAKSWHAKACYLSKPEQEELDKFIRENLEKDYIHLSKSSMASPFFFIKKKDGKLRPVQDYCKLNEVTIKNQYPLPLISELMDQLNMRWGYNNVCIKEGDEHTVSQMDSFFLYFLLFLSIFLNETLMHPIIVMLSHCLP